MELDTIQSDESPYRNKDTRKFLRDNGGPNGSDSLDGANVDHNLVLDDTENYVPLSEIGVDSQTKAASSRKRIDYILVYDNKHPDEIHGRHNKEEWEKHRQNREKFKKVMLRAGLQIQEVISGQHMFVKIHAPHKVLCKQAENIKLQMPLRGAMVDQYDDGPPSFITRMYDKYLQTDDEVDFVSASFIYDKLHLFEKGEDEETFFTPAIRSYLVYQILIHLDIRDKQQGDDESLAKHGEPLYFRELEAIMNPFAPRRVDHGNHAEGLPYLLLKGSYSDAFLLHDESASDPIVEEIIREQHKNGKMSDQMADNLRKRTFARDPRVSLKSTWTRWFKAQPMWKIRNYFGEKIAFYFAWSGQLITSLWIPSLLGFCIFLYGLYLSFTDSGDDTSSTDANVTTASPTGQVINQANDLLESIKESFDNLATPAFSLIICLWGSIFLETWKRKRAVLAYEWDVDGFEATEPDRPEFYGTKTKPDPVTNIATWYYPLARQFMKFLASCAVLVVMVIIVLISGTAVVIYRVIIEVDYCGSLEGYQCLLAATIASSVLNAVSILLLGRLYEWIAYKLTDWENHRTRSDYDNALIIKLFVFQFANSYASLFYIAFFRGNLRNISNGFFGMGANYVDRCSGTNGDNCMSMLSFQVLVLMIMKPIPKFFKDVILPWVKSLWRDGYIFSCCRRNKVRASIIAKDINDSNDYIERERIKPQLGDFTLSEYTEKVIQYGYLMLFAVSLPLAPLIALLTNLADLRVDARRLIWVYRRPVAYMACDIGMWYGILEFVNLMGVISNAMLIAFTSTFGKQILTTMEMKLWAVIVFEHLVFGLKFLISYTIPDIPSDVSLNMRRERYQVAKIFSGDTVDGKSRRVVGSRGLVTSSPRSLTPVSVSRPMDLANGNSV